MNSNKINPKESDNEHNNLNKNISDKGLFY